MTTLPPLGSIMTIYGSSETGPMLWMKYTNGAGSLVMYAVRVVSVHEQPAIAAPPQTESQCVSSDQAEESVAATDIVE